MKYYIIGIIGFLIMVIGLVITSVIPNIATIMITLSGFMLLIVAKEIRKLDRAYKRDFPKEKINGKNN